MSHFVQPEARKHQTPSKPSIEHTILQYRNGFFQGYIDDYSQRQGRGAYLWNTGEIYYGEWNQDHMEGEGIFYFALGGYVYGTFLDDRVHGYAVLCFSNGDYTAGFWEKGVLNGKVVQHSKVDNDWCLDEYKDGMPIRTLMKGKGAPPLDTFTMLETYSIKKLLEKESGLFAGDKAANERSDRAHLDFLAIDPDGWYHGNIQSRGPHGLGIVCYSEHKSDRGLFKNGALSGLGRSLFSNGDVYDGFYKEGRFHGIGVYFKSETEQYLYGMYENNECVQALTLGNGYPHELMRTLKADFHLESAEFVDKETETEVLTLAYGDQNPEQEQESQYEDSSKYQLHEKNAHSRKRREEEEKNRNLLRDVSSASQVQDSQASEQSQSQSQRRPEGSERAIKKETETRSSISSKRSNKKSKRGTNPDLEVLVAENLSNKDKAGSRRTVQEEDMINSRVKNLEKEKLKNSISSHTSGEQSEYFVSRKSIQGSEVAEKKSASKTVLDSVYKSMEKAAYENYSNRTQEAERTITGEKSHSSYSGSPHRDDQQTSYYKTDHSEAKEVEVQQAPQITSYGNPAFYANTATHWEGSALGNPSTSMSYHVRASDIVEKTDLKIQPIEARASHSLATDYSVSDRSTSTNVNGNTVVQAQSYEIKPSYQFLADHVGADRSAEARSSFLTSYTGEAPKSSYSNVVAQGSSTLELTAGIDSQVRKIMDKIFIQNASANSLSIPLHPTTIETGLSGAGSYMFGASDKSSDTYLGRPADRSPTFAQANNDYNHTFDYTQSSNSLTGYNITMQSENKDRTGSDHLPADWNIKVYPSLESSLMNLKQNQDVRKSSQVTGSFGLLPNAPSEESLSSKMYFEQRSQASGTYLEIDLTRDRAATGKFGGSSEPTNPPSLAQETMKPEGYKAEGTYKNYNFNGENQISTSHSDIDAKSYLKAKTPINKKIEHSREVPYENIESYPSPSNLPTIPTERSYLDYGRAHEVTTLDRAYVEHIKSTALINNTPYYEIPSGGGSKTDTWSAYTPPADLTSSQIMKKYGAEKYQADNSRNISLKDVPSEILDGSVSNRYEFVNKGIYEKKAPEVPLYSMPIEARLASTLEKVSSNSRLEEELYKIILLKLELLVKEQSKAAETADDIKRCLNQKLDSLFREERRENENFKVLLNQKLDALFKERTFELSREQLAQIHQDLTSSNKQISASFTGVNKKLDLLLLKQGRLTVETEDNLVNKLDNVVNNKQQHSRQSSLQANAVNLNKQLGHKDSIMSKAEEPRSSIKSDANENVRSEIFIADSSAEYNTQKDLRKASTSSKQPAASPNVMIKDFTRNTELSREQKVYKSNEREHTRKSLAEQQPRKIDHDMSNISDEATEYASLASDTAPLKVVKSMQPKSKEFSIKNEHTLNLLQYESELKEKQYITPKKSDKETIYTPKDKTPGIPRSLTPTPQSRGHTEVSQRNYDQVRSPHPITSQNASMVMDYGSNERQDKKKSVYTFPVSQPKESTPVRDSSQWHVVPLCAQESLFDEPEEIIEEQHEDYSGEERKTQSVTSPGGNFTNRSHVSKGQKSELKKNSLMQSHNRANSISSQSSYNVFDLKSFRGSTTMRKSNMRDSREFQAPNNTAQSVFDNFVVTSNNNDIAAGGEYVRIEKNTPAQRNMAFMRKEFESPSGPKLSSAKKQLGNVVQNEVNLYESERAEYNKKKSGSKGIYPWKNEEGYERNSAGYVQASPNKSPNRSSKTVYQEGRLGTVRWRLEIEDMANETEGSQGGQDEYERNLMFEKKIKALSVMSSPIGQRREFDHLMKSVNPAKDIGTYENHMFSTGKYSNEEVMSSGEKGYRQTEAKVPSLALGGDIPTNRSKKQKPYGYQNLSISHFDKEMKY